MPRIKPFVLCLALAAFGLGVSSYLFSRHLDLKTGAARNGGVCSALFGESVSCDDALLSSAAERFGLPLAGWGMVYFCGIGALLLSAGTGNESRARLGVAVAFFGSLIGAAAGVSLCAQMLSGAAPKCPLCFSIHAADIALPFALRWLAGAPIVAMARSLVGLAATRGRHGVVNLCMAAIAAFAMHQWASVREARSEVMAQASGSDPAAALAAYLAAPVEAVGMPAASKRLGTDSAPARLLVFSDFQCPGCAGFAMAAKKLQEKYPDDLQIAYRHFPLNTVCNAAAAKDLHLSACEASLASEAAALQGRFWQFHDALFAANAKGGTFGHGEIEAALQNAGIDMAAMQKDWESGALHRAVLDDIAAAVDAGVPGTPTVFLNGRRLKDFSPGALEAVVKHAIGQAGEDRDG